MTTTTARPARKRFHPPTRRRHRAGFLILAIILFAVGASMLYLNIMDHYRETVDAHTYSTRRDDIAMLRNEMRRETGNQWYYAMLLCAAVSMGVWICCPYTERAADE